MNKHFFIWAFIFVSAAIIGCDGKHSSNQELIHLQRLTVIQSPISIIVRPVDLPASTVRWKRIKKGRLDGHEGTIRLKKGQPLFRGDLLVGGYLVVGMNAIRITGIPAREAVAMRYLTKQSKSGFTTHKYPIAAFVITNVYNISADSLVVQGNITIAIDKHISIPAVITHADDSLQMFSTVFKQERFAWHIGDEGS